MKPKKMKCPICGKDMVATSWGRQRDSSIAAGIVNFVNYECIFSCNCKVIYEGSQDCWE